MTTPEQGWPPGIYFPGTQQYPAAYPAENPPGYRFPAGYPSDLATRNKIRQKRRGKEGEGRRKKEGKKKGGEERGDSKRLITRLSPKNSAGTPPGRSSPLFFARLLSFLRDTTQHRCSHFLTGTHHIFQQAGESGGAQSSFFCGRWRCTARE